MRKYLASIDAAFYHITLATNWENKIKLSGIISFEGKIFVSRSNSPSILNSIALNQLPEIYDNPKIAILKFPQMLNCFLPEEISVDMQSNEPTMPLQNIILRQSIPISQIVLENIYDLNIDKITLLVNKSDSMFRDSIIFQDALTLVYEDQKPCYKLADIQTRVIFECPK